jgi:hypothetical protein
MRFAKELLAVSLPCGVAAVSLAACGARGPLESGTGGLEAVVQSSGGEDAAVVDDAASHPDASAGASSCSAMLAACQDSNACAQILSCVIATCASLDGGSQTTCAIGCANGNFQQLSSMMQLFACLQGGGAGTAGGAGSSSSSSGAGGGTGGGASMTVANGSSGTTIIAMM